MKAFLFLRLKLDSDEALKLRYCTIVVDAENILQQKKLLIQRHFGVKKLLRSYWTFDIAVQRDRRGRRLKTNTSHRRSGHAQVAYHPLGKASTTQVGRLLSTKLGRIGGTVIVLLVQYSRRFWKRFGFRKRFYYFFEYTFRRLLHHATTSRHGQKKWPHD